MGLEGEGVGVGQGEIDVDRVLGDQRDQRAAGRADDIARRDIGGAGEAADRGGDGGVAKIDPRRFHLGLGREHGGMIGLLGGFGLVERGLRAGGGVEQRLGAGKGDLGKGLLGLGLSQGGLGLIERGLIGRALDFVERLALGDIGAVGEVLGFEIAGDAGLDVDDADRGDMARVAGFIAHRLGRDHHIAGLGGRGLGRRLGQGGGGQQGQDDGGREAVHAMVLTFSAS